MLCSIGLLFEVWALEILDVGCGVHGSWKAWHKSPLRLPSLPSIQLFSADRHRLFPCDQCSHLDLSKLLEEAAGQW